MIYFYTNRVADYEFLTNHTAIKLNDVIAFNKFVAQPHSHIQLDTETTMVDYLYDYKYTGKGKNKTYLLNEQRQRIPVERECTLLQIGDKDGVDQYLFEVQHLNTDILATLKMLLSNDSITKIGHNLLFEYTIIKKDLGVSIYNLLDTYLASVVLNTGRLPEEGFHSLAGCLKRYLRIDISKAAQTTFDGSPLDYEQILYAATDVAPLKKLADLMLEQLKQQDLMNTFNLECSLIIPYGESMLDNVYFDTEAWSNLMESNRLKVVELQAEFEKTARDLYFDECLEKGLIRSEDEYVFNFRSNKFKETLLKYFYPDLEGHKLEHYKAYKIKCAAEEKDTEFLDHFLNKNEEAMKRMVLALRETHREDLIKIGVLLPKDEFLVNTNSPAQLLELFKLVEPTLESTNEEHITKLAKRGSTLAKAYGSLAKAKKVYQSYGQNYLDAVNFDGKFRVLDYRQILKY